MPLQKQNMPIQLGLGLDSKTDPKQLLPGKLLNLQNGVLEAKKKIRKRNGYSQIAALGGPSQGGTSFNDELISFSNGAVSSYSESLAAFVTKQSGVPQLQISSGAIASPLGTTVYDSILHQTSGLRVTLFSGAGIYYSVIDESTGVVLVAPTLISTTNQASTLKVATCGKYVFLFYYTPNSRLAYSAVDTTNPTGAVTITTISSSIGVDILDCVTVGTTTYLAAVTTGPNIVIFTINSSLAVTVLTTLLGSNPTTCLGIAVDRALNQLWLVYATGVTLKYQVFTLAGTPTMPETVISTKATNWVNVTAYPLNGQAEIFAELYSMAVIVGSGHTFQNGIYLAIANNTGANNISFLIGGLGIISKPFSITIGNRSTLCFVAGYSGFEQGYAFVVTESGNILGKMGPAGTANGTNVSSNNATFSQPVEVDLISNTKVLVPVLIQTFGFSFNGLIDSDVGVTIETLDFNSSLNFQSLSASQDLLLSNAVVQMYDGANVVEDGYHIIPEEPQLSSVNIGSSILGNGPYNYILVYEWFDNQGNLHQSSPSPALVVDTTSSGSVQSISLHVPNLQITNKVGVVLSLFRNTIANPTTFFRIQSSPQFSSANIKTTAFQTIIDSQTDALISTQSQLYTDGGNVGNFALPATKTMWNYRNRVIAIPSETPSQAWFSQLIVQGIPGTPVFFSDVFTIQIPTRDGEVIGGCEMDDKSVVFKTNTIWYFIGDGPNNTGANSDFTTVQQVPTDTGCITPKSIVVSPIGAFFQSAKGIYLLDRSLNVQYVGQDVEEFNSDSVTSATMIENTTQIRFLLDSGVVLTYDYLLGQWDVFENQISNAGFIYRGQYTLSNSDGTVWQETPGTYSDNGAYIPLSIKTGWVNVNQLQGYCRVYKVLLLGTYYTPHNLTVNIYYDFSETPQQTVVINATTAVVHTDDLYGDDTPYGNESPYGGLNIPYQFRIHTSQQKCETIMIEITDSSDADSIGQAFDLSGIALEVAAEPNVMRLPAAQSFG